MFTVRNLETDWSSETELKHRQDNGRTGGRAGSDTLQYSPSLPPTTGPS